MSFIQQAFRNLHPILQFVFICCVVVAGMAVTVVAGMKIANIVCDNTISASDFLKQLNLVNTDAGVCGALLINSLNQIIAFGGAGTVFTLLYGNYTGIGFSSKGRSKKLWRFIIGGGVLTMCVSPILEIMSIINEWIISKLGPQIYSMALDIEDKAAEMTVAMLQIDSTNSFVITLIAVAVLPAVFEEYLFRGTFQPMFAKWSGNIHIGIWTSAALFSLIHIQFFGFLPRMFLGAGFGYLVVASGSLWPAISGHFINNGVAVLSAWWFGADWISENINQSESVWTSKEWTIAIGFATLIVFGITQLKKWSVWGENEIKYLEPGQLSNPLES
jgi:membrane protease YdiL (CAAX protease family)|tara:strand:- start:685 stop:1677 length:993 start_codon:yes stop_codon:yes gene_type:complete